jgi:methionyl-tRNA synthetase
MIKTDKEATGIVLYDCIQIIANLALIAEPFLPFSSKKLFEMLNLDGSQLNWKNIGDMQLVKGNHKLGTASLLFEKIEDDIIETQIAKLTKTVEQKPESGNQKSEIREQKSEIKQLSPEIVFDDFAKIDLRVGTILTAEKVEKADKLLKLSVDLGFETRTIVSGIAEHFKPEELPGIQVCVVANLASRKLRGIESKGMILLAEDKNGKLIFVSPTTVISNGSVVR